MRAVARVQHHPARADLIAALLERLAGFDTEVITDTRTGPPQTWRTHRACLESGLATDATHVLVVQDDAVPCDGFADRARALIDQKPESVLCLFAPGFGFLRRIGLQAKIRHESLAEFPVMAFVPLVAIVYPAPLAASLLRWADRTPWVGRRERADDGLVASWARERKVRPLMAVPPLVDHDDTVPSVMRRTTSQGTHRRAVVL